MDKISIVVPIYNVEPYLRQCLDSIIHQTYSNLEIIAIDDGSPDSCGSICDEYTRKDKRVVVIHKKNAGVGAARNDGIRVATGKWIAFVDPDDWYDPNYIYEMSQTIPATSIDVICSAGHIAEFPTRSIERRNFETPFKDMDGTKKAFLIKKTLVLGYGVNSKKNPTSLAFPWDKLFRTDFLRKSHIQFDEHLHPYEDFLFNIDVFAQSCGVITNECIGYHYREGNESSSMKRFNPAWPEMRERFMNKLLSFIAGLPNTEQYEEVCDARAIRLISLNLSLYFFHPNNPKTYTQVAQEIKEMRNSKSFHRAIYGKNIKFLTKNQIIMKYCLRLPWIWPLRLLFLVNEKRKRKIYG